MNARVANNAGGGRSGGGGHWSGSDDGSSSCHTGSGSSGLNLYHDPPDFELSLDQFEVYALKRLRVLRKLEQMKRTKQNPQAVKSSIALLLKEEGLMSSSSDPNDRNLIDVASHFILRLSYCHQKEDVRRWFVQQESDLFKFRVQALSRPQLAQSLYAHAHLSPMDANEKAALRNPLFTLFLRSESGGDTTASAVTAATSEMESLFAKEDFYKVPFTHVLELVAARQVYVAGGFAYVAHSKAVSILHDKFRTDLTRNLSLMAAHQGAWLLSSKSPEVARIQPLLKNLNSCLTLSTSAQEENHWNNGSGGTFTLTANNLPNYTEHMPLCMRQLQHGLETDHKLKHDGRMQYGLFLKGAGLSMEEAFIFFERYFTKIMSAEAFQKQYSYGIRHMHGQEGKRVNYTPYSCTKIILGNNAPSSGHHHGCPYKHYDSHHLAKLLDTLNIGSKQDQHAILKLKDSFQYQLACKKHFEVTHKNAAAEMNSLENVGNHPNAWFRASVAYRDQQQTKMMSGETTHTTDG